MEDRQFKPATSGTANLKAALESAQRSIEESRALRIKLQQNSTVQKSPK